MAGFGTWEHLAPIVRNLHNHRIRDFWKHERYDKFTNDPNIQKSPRWNLMKSTQIQADDSAVIMLLKIVLFEIVIGNAARLQPGIYGIPCQTWDEYTFNNRPEIFLFFEEDIAPTPDGYSRVQAEVKFRIMDETPETMTKAKATSLANKIKLAFGTIPTWDFTKGKHIWTYQDKKEGYWLQIYSDTETDAEALTKKVLSVQGHTFDSDKFKQSTPKKNSSNITGNIVIMGQTVKKRRYRPQKKVRFRYATLNVPGVDPVVLYDPYRRLNSAGLAE